MCFLIITKFVFNLGIMVHNNQPLLLHFRILLILICNAMYCNAEGYFKIMRSYYDGRIGSKSFAKDIMRYCEIHAKKMGDDAVVVTVLPDSNKKYLSTSLLNAEPPQDGYITPQVQLQKFSSIR